MAAHVFVAMPYGRKQDIEFDAVYADYLKPALEEAGFRVFRADEERRAGDIRVDMFQELLLADLVVVDLSIDNPNVWYELGVRHALRARGVLLVQSARTYQPFDVYTERKLRYHLLDGRPDPAHLSADRAALAAMALATMQSWHGRPSSPVYHLLRDLREPPWRDLLLTGDNEFRAAYEAWHRRVEVARKRNRPGDVLVLAEETPTWAMRLEARRAAGRALMKLRQYRLALEQVEAALELAADDPGCQRDKAILLGRLGRHDAALEWAHALVRQRPAAAEDWCLVGRLEKDDWVRRWRREDTAPEAMRAAAAGEIAQLAQAVEPYLHAFVLDPAHFYSGINACTLRHLQRHLGGGSGQPAGLADLEGGVSWAIRAAVERQPRDYWARASLAELEVLLGPPARAREAWQAAVTLADKDWFALDSSRQQLCLLRDLGFRPEAVAGALDVIEREIADLAPPWQPRRVFLFSGHMLDAPGRAGTRFPAAKETRAAAAIAGKLDELGMTAGDLAICGGACGGDILFAEAALARGCRVELYLQFAEPEFLQASVAFAGEDWVERYYALKAREDRVGIRVQTEELGPPPAEVNPYERNNLWQLFNALAHGPDQVRFLALWNGEGGQGPGGTRHMVETVRKYAGRVALLDTRALFAD